MTPAQWDLFERKECPIHWLPIGEGLRCLGCEARISGEIVRKARGIIPINKIPLQVVSNDR